MCHHVRPCNYIILFLSIRTLWRNGTWAVSVALWTRSVYLQLFSPLLLTEIGQQCGPVGAKPRTGPIIWHLTLLQLLNRQINKRGCTLELLWVNCSCSRWLLPNVWIWFAQLTQASSAICWWHNLAKHEKIMWSLLCISFSLHLSLCYSLLDSEKGLSVMLAPYTLWQKHIELLLPLVGYNSLWCLQTTTDVQIPVHSRRKTKQRQPCLQQTLVLVLNMSTPKNLKKKKKLTYPHCRCTYTYRRTQNPCAKNTLPALNSCSPAFTALWYTDN